MRFCGGQKVFVIDHRIEIFDRAIKTVALFVICVSGVLAFRHLDVMGLTWDEFGDYLLVSQYLRERNFITNASDPSQGRFSHLIATAFLYLFGPSYFVFKLPFVIIGLGAGLGLWKLLSRHVSANVALLFAALYFSSPYVLAAARTAATAGDVLLMALTLAFIGTLHAFINSGCFWPYGALCAVVCGAATGTKWTSGLLLVAVFAYQLTRGYRSQAVMRRGQLWTELFAFAAIAGAIAIATSPSFLNGLPFLLEGIRDSRSYDTLHMLYMGEVRPRPPWYYIPAVLISKFPAPIVLTFLFACAQALVFRLRLGSCGVLREICLLSLLPIIPLAAKPSQNAHYFITAVPAVLILSALLVDRWVRQSSRFWRYVLLLITIAVLLCQLLLSFWLSPDFLQAGRQFGPRFQGQFSGPAVNHCQGCPLALQAMNRLVRTGGPQSVYLLDSCAPIMNHAIEFGPVTPLVRVNEYPRRRPKEPHYVIINAIFLYDGRSEAGYRANVKRKSQATRDCPLVASHTAFEIYKCEATQ